MSHQQFITAIEEFKKPSSQEPVETSKQMRSGMHIHEVKNNLLKYSAKIKDGFQINPTFQFIKIPKPVEKAPL
jgi:hypothetical protein